MTLTEAITHAYHLGQRNTLESRGELMKLLADWRNVNISRDKGGEDDARREALLILTSVILAAGGKVEVEPRHVSDAAEATLTRFDTPRYSVTFTAAIAQRAKDQS